MSPDPTRNAWATTDFGRYHQDAIRDNLFRSLLISFVKPEVRKSLKRWHEAWRHPRGADSTVSYVPLCGFDVLAVCASFTCLLLYTRYISTSPDGRDATFCASREKLHQTSRWRRLFLTRDMKPLFQDGSEKSARILQVFVRACFFMHCEHPFLTCHFTVHRHLESVHLPNVPPEKWVRLRHL